MSDKKALWIEFYRGAVGADGQAGSVADILAGLAATGERPVFQYGRDQHEIRDHVYDDEKEIHRGVFAKFRTSDLPSAGTPGGAERDIKLGDDEGLIEKNYFLYVPRYELLVYQRNKHGNTTRRMAGYFTQVCGVATAFHPVLQHNALERLRRGDRHAVSLELSIARPTNAEFYPDNEWNRELFNLLDASGGARMKVVITSGDRRRNPAAFLRDRVKDSAAELAELRLATVARVTMDGEDVAPIDLLADRLLSRKTVTMSGRYPAQASMFEALEEAFDEHINQFEALFGGREPALA